MNLSSSEQRIAVVVLNYNSADDCRVCVSFLKQQQGVDLEIILVDNHSRPPEREKVEALCKETGCTFIQNDVNSGYNAGNNVGLRYAASKGYEYAAIVNPDMEFPQEDCFRKCLVKLVSDYSIVVIAPDITLPNGEHQNPQYMYSDNFFRLIYSPFEGFLVKGRLIKKKPFIDPNYRVSRYCEKVSGCFYIVRMSFIRKIGFFDENVFLYCEEPILAKQVEQERKKIFFLAECYAFHRHRIHEIGNPSKGMKQFWKSQRYFYSKYLGLSKIQIFFINLFHGTAQTIWRIAFFIKYRGKV